MKLKHILSITALAAVMTTGFVFYEQASLKARVMQERALVQAGATIRDAVAAHYQAKQHLPQALDELIVDPVRKRSGYLTSIPRDPMTSSRNWGLIQDDRGYILGVYSRSTLAPTGLVVPDGLTAAPARYTDWRFTFQPSEKSAPVALLPTPDKPKLVVAAQKPVPPTAPGGEVALAVTAQQPQMTTEVTRRAASLCTFMQRSDSSICNGVESRAGPHAAASCRASAQIRASACSTQAATDQLPPLSTPTATGDI